MLKRIPIAIVGGHYIGKATEVDAQECINLYPVNDTSGGKKRSLHPTPGRVIWKDFSLSGKPIREMHRVNDTEAYVICHSSVYKIDQTGSETLLASTLDNATGPCQMEDNGTQVLIADLTDGKGYVVESDVVTKITDADFPTVSSLTYQDGYAIVSKDDTKTFAISTLDGASLAAYEASDFTRWDVLEKKTVSALKSKLKAVFSDHSEVWAFGESTFQPFYNSAATDFPFTKTQTAQKAGIGGSSRCIVSLDNSIFWLDNWHNVRRAVGYTPVIISTSEISHNIEQFSTKSDAFAFGYQQAGHAFYVITFPTADKTYVYEVSANEWHLRSTGLTGGRWGANCYMEFAGEHLVGDATNGIIHKLDRSAFTDAGETMRSVRVTGHTGVDGRQLIYHRLEIHMKTGVGNNADPGKDPLIFMQYSDDGGHNFSSGRFGNLGKIGATKTRVFWDGLGMSRDRIFKFTITDPVDRVIMALFADITVGNS